MVSERPANSMPANPSMRDRSISCGGLARRSFIVGRSVWPPARSLASAFLPRRLTACRSVSGRWKVKLYIAVLRLSLSHHAACGTDLPDFCNAAHTAGGVAGMARASVPIALVMALMTAAGAAMAPASPQPLMPSGLDGHLVIVVSTLSAG